MLSHSKLLAPALLALLPACASAPGESSARPPMQGAWASSDGRTMLLIEDELCVQAQDASQMLFGLQYQGEVALRTQLYLGQPVPGGLEWTPEGLFLVNPVEGERVRFERLSVVPEALLIEPFALGTPPASAVDRAAIGRGLMQREATSLRLRRSIQDNLEAARLSGRMNSLEAQQELMASPKMLSLREQLVANYAANTAHIEGLLRRRGWISKQAYGEEPHLAAFNMVRFSGNLRLMRSILPALEAELQDDPSIGALYSVLYDSIQLSLGEKQRYGTLLLPDLDGRLRLKRVEHKAGLDERRQQLGLPPIREFLANFERQYGTIRVED